MYQLKFTGADNERYMVTVDHNRREPITVHLLPEQGPNLLVSMSFPSDFYALENEETAAEYVVLYAEKIIAQTLNS
jgi:hypothetical protein